MEIKETRSTLAFFRISQREKPEDLEAYKRVLKIISLLEQGLVNF
jgi:hypothetical protein